MRAQPEITFVEKPFSENLALAIIFAAGKREISSLQIDTD